MASAAQTLANQENAKFSTGPRTEAGKQKSSSNAYRHGLHATSEKLFATNPEERDHYEQIKADLRSETLPAAPPKNSPSNNTHTPASRHSAPNASKPNPRTAGSKTPTTTFASPRWNAPSN